MPSLLVLYWLAVGALVVALHLARGPFARLVPRRTKDLYSYGKLLVSKGTPSKSPLLLPKRFFTLFYILGLLWAILFLGYMLAAASGVSLPFQSSAMKGLQLLARDEWTESWRVLNSADVIFWTVLLQFQVGRRLYECLFVMVQSRSASFHILHFVYGLTFYFFVTISPFSQVDLLGEKVHLDLAASLTVSRLLRWAVCLIVFLWASYHQNRCHAILGDLRQKKSHHNEQSKAKYGLPRGDWFDSVSSPHYLAETIIYITFACVLGGNCWLAWAVLWATFGHLSVIALETHDWYQHMFDDYPKTRSAIVPFLL